MPQSDPANDSAHALGGEMLNKPGTEHGGAGRAKLPLITAGSSDGPKAPEEVRRAWIEYMVNGFQNNEEMFRRTLEAFMKPYYLTIWMYGAMFVVGIALFVVAAVAGLRDGSSPVAVVFAGLGAGTFLMFFIRQPLQALEENLEFISWLGVAFNTYWTRLMYMLEAKTVQADLKAADDDYSNTVERLIARHAELRVKRPGDDREATSGVKGD
ncbi:MAG: hypothetical protein HY895_06310 [Deltaproteobacteria bacterium]|nr:hypothetical protein [Deltaproteobacteria bacterium]